VSAEALSGKYISAMEKVLETVELKKGDVAVSEDCLDEAFGYVTAYLQDAKYYQEKRQFETSLVAIAYCEGVLDALKIIGAVKIDQPATS
jgi:FAD synthetase